MKKKFQNIFKLCAFALVFVLLLNAVSEVFVYVPTDTRPYQALKGFQLEEEDSLDAVFIGSSSTFAYWNPLLMWNEYGITSYNYAVPSCPIEAYKYMIEEARKTQPDAVYVLTITDPAVGSSKTVVYRFANNMPFSSTKHKLIKTLLDNLKNDIDLFERLQFYIPIIKFHSRWSELSYEDDFNRQLTGYKNSSSYSSYMKKSTDFTNKFNMTEERVEMPEDTAEVITDLLDYCDANSVKVLILISPQVNVSDEKMGILNTIKDTVESRGYPVLDGRTELEKTGLDLSKDFYNDWHTNIHGSIKYSDFVAKRLMEYYQFTDKRNDEAYSNWNEIFNEYNQIVGSYYLDIETDIEHRDASIKAPKLNKLTQKNGIVTLTWEASESQVDGYLIYRKQGNNVFKLVETVESSQLTYVDQKANKPGKRFKYIVVPYVIDENGTMIYGDFNYDGVYIDIE